MSHKTRVKIAGPLDVPGAYRPWLPFASPGIRSIDHVEAAIQQGRVTRPGLYAVLSASQAEVALVRVETGGLRVSEAL